MRKLLFIAVALLIVSCGSLSKIFDNGTLDSKAYMEVIPFKYDDNIALIDVEINAKKYTFLVDTGAPTVISTAIFKDLNLKSEMRIPIGDSQGQRNMQEVVYVPEIKIGNLTYNKIGAVVADLSNVFEFKCMSIDGIIGANQMAKSFWKFDYIEKQITISDRLENYDLRKYTDTISFTTSTQKTPKVSGIVNGFKTAFTYDTGSSGYIDVSKNLSDFKDATGYKRYGSSGIGLYGTVDSTTIRVIKVDSLNIGDISMGTQVIELDHGGLIGNRFMNKHEVVMDWSASKIYLKKIADYEETEKKSFGFGFRIIDNKAVVISLTTELPIALALGDILLSVNNFNLRDITNENACERYDAVKLKDLEKVEITFMRGDKEYSTVITKTVLID